MGIITILWEKWVEFRRDFYKITLAAMIAPLMYLLVFGMGVFKWRRVLRCWSCGFLSGKKPCGRAEIFKLSDYTDGLFV